MKQGDLLVRGGTVVDGTGSAGVRSDVRVRDGRIVEIGARLSPDGEAEIDASGAVVAPGFIDTHAHMDPQVFWDPTLDPDPQHGVTTTLVGNCSLSLYPAADADARAQIADLFSYIEDVPRHLFDDSVPWTWTDYAGYRDAVNAGGTGINVAALVGHSPIRLAVLGNDAWDADRVVSTDELAAMTRLLAEARAAGAWGLSTSFLDVDAHGRPVPSRNAGEVEFAALLDVVGAAPRGLLEFVPALLGPTPEREMEMLARLCASRGVPLTWTGFTHTETMPARTEFWLDLTRRLRSEGAQIWPQLSPRTVDFRLNWDSSMLFMSMPQGWHQVIAARGPEAKAALLNDPVWRDTARAEWDATERAMFPHRRIELVRFVEVNGVGQERWLGASLGDLVAERGGHPSDVFADFVLANDCSPGVVAVGISNSNVDGVAGVLADPNVLWSSSDAGAHVQMLCASGDPTLFLTRHVRDRGDFTLEHAVHQLTGRQREAFGFDGRGRVAHGDHGDLVIFALDELHYDADEFVHDLPGGGARLRRPEGGFRATIVSGVPVQEQGKLTGALPGRVIASNA